MIASAVNRRVMRFVSQNAALISIVVLSVFFATMAPSFRSFKNIAFLLYSATPLIVIAIGMGFVVLTGSLDISLGSTAYLSIAVSALLMDFGTVSVWQGVVVAVALFPPDKFDGATNGVLPNEIVGSPAWPHDFATSFFLRSVFGVTPGIGSDVLNG